MNLKEMLKMADDLVFAKTGQHLNDLQEAILQGTMQGEKYAKIADKFHCNESYVRDVGSKLWQIFSEGLGEEVHKSNFRAAIERWHNSNILNYAQNVSGSFNICGEGRHPENVPNSNSPPEQNSPIKPPETPHYDLSEMPELGVLYSRTRELETLQTWILQHRCHLIALTGICGIGKTTLAVQLVRQIKDEFEQVVWYSLDASPTFPELEERLLQFFSDSEPQNAPENSPTTLPLIKYLQTHRSLVILDDIHTLFKSGELAGKYKSGYEDYRSFFKKIEKLSHQSCVLLIGWEPPREVAQCNTKTNAIRNLQLGGLDMEAQREILREYSGAEIENDSALLYGYQGNPLWLQSVATLIQELGGSVTEFLPKDTILLPEDLKEILHDRLSRLSEIEKQLMGCLARENLPVTLAKLLENETMPASDLLNALQSLSRRCLIEKQDNLYSLSPAIALYVKGLS